VTERKEKNANAMNAKPVVVTVTRRFPNMAEEVFDAFLDPGKAARFMFATPTGAMVKAEIDPWVGGAFIFVDRRDGEDVAHSGTYIVIDRPRRLVFTLNVPKYSQRSDRVSIEISAVPNGCELKLTHEMASLPVEKSAIQRGWAEILDNVAATLGDTARKTPPATARVTQHFDAPAERVFDAWLDTALLGQWMFGIAFNDEVLAIRIDPRVGGAFSFLIRRQGQEIDHIGKYLVIDRPRRLVFTWAIAPASPEPEFASLVTIEIVPQGAGCALVLTHDIPAEWADYAERVTQGWTKILAAQNKALNA
jgi:uncharacterized protein YndB with AHSA1/START domain